MTHAHCKSKKSWPILFGKSLYMKYVSTSWTCSTDYDRFCGTVSYFALSKIGFLGLNIPVGGAAKFSG